MRSRHCTAIVREQPPPGVVLPLRGLTSWPKHAQCTEPLNLGDMEPALLHKRDSLGALDLAVKTRKLPCLPATWAHGRCANPCLLSPEA